MLAVARRKDEGVISLAGPTKVVIASLAVRPGVRLEGRFATGRLWERLGRESEVSRLAPSRPRLVRRKSSPSPDRRLRPSCPS